MRLQFLFFAVFLEARSLEGIHRQFQERGLPAPTEIGLCVFVLFVIVMPEPWLLKFAHVCFFQKQLSGLICDNTTRENKCGAVMLYLGLLVGLFNCYSTVQLSPETGATG
jgi:hypothetical protein